MTAMATPKIMHVWAKNSVALFAYYNGLAFVMEFPNEAKVKEFKRNLLCTPQRTPAEIIDMKETLNVIDERFGALPAEEYTQKEALTLVFRNVLPEHVLTYWFICVSDLLKHKAIVDDEMNGWQVFRGTKPLIL